MSAIERLVRTTTRAQGRPERVEDPETARRLAVLLDRPSTVDKGGRHAV